MNGLRLFIYESHLYQELEILSEQIKPEEKGILDSLKGQISNAINKAKSVINPRNIPKNVGQRANQILQDLKTKTEPYSKENYPLSLLEGFNFFNNIKVLKEGFFDKIKTALNSPFMKAVWAIIKYFFIALIDLLNAALVLLRDSVTGSGMVQIIIFWVGPVIAISPVGARDLLGVSPLIAWAIFHAFVKPALYKLGGAVRVDDGSYSADDPKVKAPLGQGFLFTPIQTSGQTPNLMEPE